METKRYVIENPYEARLTIEPAVTKIYLDGKARRRERRKKARKN